MKTLGDLKNSTIPAAIGVAACDPRFTQLANEVQDQLTPKGRWWGSTKRLRICVTSKCITWPSGVATIDGFNIAGWGVPPRNDWFEFQDNVRTIEAARCTCGPQQLLDRGFTPQYRDYTGNAYIRIYPISTDDEDAVVLLQGNDQNGNPIRTSDVDGWFDGEKVTIASPFVESVSLFKQPGLLGVQKPLTKSYLKVFSVDAVTGLETQIATWGPSETAPQYRRSALVHLPKKCDTREDKGNVCSLPLVNCQNVVAEAIVRLEPIQLVVDTDWLLIGNVAAMKAGMKAAQKEDKNDYQGAGIEWSKAITLLREELGKYDPPERMAVNVVFGATMTRSVGGVF